MTHTTSHLAVLQGLSNCREVQLSTGRLAITRYSVNANAMTALRYAGLSLWRTFAMADRNPTGWLDKPLFITQKIWLNGKDA